MATRRTKGDGSLFQRKSDGLWVGRFTIETPTGRKVRRVVYGKTQKEARIKLEQGKRQRDAGTLVLNSMTVGAWFDYWLEHIVTERAKPQTVKAYGTAIRRSIQPHLGHLRLDRLQPEHVDQWLRVLAETPTQWGKPMKPATIAHAHTVFRTGIREAVKRRKIALDPTVAANTPRNPKVHRERLTADQAHDLLADCPDPRWWLALFYGMRQGECLGLRWGDLDFERGVLHIRQSLQSVGGGGVTFGTPKTATSVRSIPLMPAIEMRLRLHQPSGADDEALVFPRADGSPSSPNIDREAWYALLASRGLPRVTLHSARNTAAGVMRDYGLHATLIAQILGHASIDQTHGYIHDDVERIRLALSPIAKELEAP